MIQKYQNIEFPSWLLEAANIFGSIRNIGNYQRFEDPKYNRGKEQNFTTHINGITGELIFAIFLERKSIKYEMAPIFGFTNKISGDFVIYPKNGNQYSIDIKTINQDQPSFNINVDAYNKKPVDYYGFIINNGNNADIFIINSKKIETWEIKTTFTRHYTKNISYFKKIKQHYEKN